VTKKRLEGKYSGGEKRNSVKKEGKETRINFQGGGGGELGKEKGREKTQKIKFSL